MNFRVSRNRGRFTPSYFKGLVRMRHAAGLHRMPRKHYRRGGRK